VLSSVIIEIKHVVISLRENSLKHCFENGIDDPVDMFTADCFPFIFTVVDGKWW